MYPTPPRTSARIAAAAALAGASNYMTGNRYNRSYTKTMINRKRKPARTFSMKKYIRSTQPAKHNTLSDLQVTGTHNTVYAVSPTQNITQGTTNSQRIGDSVHLLSLKVSGWVCSNATLTKATEFRIITLYSGEEYSCGGSLTTPTFSGSELWVTTATPGWGPNSITNPKAVTILDDRRITLNNSISSVSDLESFNYTVPLNTDFDYQATGSVYGKTRNLYVVVIGAILDGTSGSTAWGVTNVFTDLVFK